MATTASSQALPFVIRVLDPPFASQVLQQGKDPGTIELEGRALPYRPLTFEGRQRVKTTWYAGNTVATQQVMGPIEEPTTINGIWKDRFLGNGAARKLVFLFDRLRRAGVTLEVSWGAGVVDGSLFGGTLVRRGIITMFKHTYDRPQDVAWECTFEWSGQGEQVAPAVLSTGIQNPREGFQAVVDAAAGWLDEVRSFRDSPISRLTGFPEATLFLLKEAEESVVDATAMLFADPGRAATDVAQLERSVLERAVAASLKVVEAGRSTVQAFLAFPDVQEAVWDDAGNLLTYLGQRLGVLVTTTRASEVAGDTAAELSGQLFPEVLAEERPPIGSDLRDLAAKHYGDPDLWWIIAQHNGLSGSKVPPLPTGPSDNPSRPIAVPRRQAGVLGDLRRSC